MTGGVFLLKALVREWTPKFGLRKLETSLCRTVVYFDILNHSGVDHECDRQMDRRRHRTALAIARSDVLRRALKSEEFLAHAYRIKAWLK